MTPDLIAWIDIETDGRPHPTNIWELALVLTDHKLETVAEYTWICPQTFPNTRLNDIPTNVLRMHVNNGLIDDLYDAEEQTRLFLDSRRNDISLRIARTHETLDRLIDIALSNHGVTNEPIPYAGSGVGHYDRGIIRDRLPKTHSKLTYWGYDIGVVRRFLRLSGRGEYIPTEFTVKNENFTHRALDDIRNHLAEARIYRDLFTNLIPSRT